MSERWILLGTGGHARVILDCLRALGKDVRGVLDPDERRWGSRFEGVEIAGGDDRLGSMRDSGITHFALGLGGAPDLDLRRRLFERARETGLEPGTIVHPSAQVSASARLGQGAQVLHMAVVQAGASVGANVLVNTGALVEHDCRVGDHSHIATGAVLAGGVKVGESVFVGAGAVVRNGRTLGRGAVVGMGSVVVHDVAIGARVWGNPARDPGASP